MAGDVCCFPSYQAAHRDIPRVSPDPEDPHRAVLLIPDTGCISMREILCVAVGIVVELPNVLHEEHC
jgi:hypothetical protein